MFGLSVISLFSLEGIFPSYIGVSFNFNLMNTGRQRNHIPRACWCCLFSLRMNADVLDIKRHMGDVKIRDVLAFHAITFWFVFCGELRFIGWKKIRGTTRAIVSRLETSNAKVAENFNIFMNIINLFFFLKLVSLELLIFSYCISLARMSEDSWCSHFDETLSACNSLQPQMNVTPHVSPVLLGRSTWVEDLILFEYLKTAP